MKKRILAFFLCITFIFANVLLNALNVKADNITGYVLERTLVEKTGETIGAYSYYAPIDENGVVYSAVSVLGNESTIEESTEFMLVYSASTGLYANSKWVNYVFPKEVSYYLFFNTLEELKEFLFGGKASDKAYNRKEYASQEVNRLTGYQKTDIFIYETDISEDTINNSNSANAIDMEMAAFDYISTLDGTYMKGKNYLVLKQFTIPKEDDDNSSGGGVDMDTGRKITTGIVETVEDVELSSYNNTVYVVISTETPSKHISLSFNTLENIIYTLHNIAILFDNRNDYPAKSGPIIVYNKKSTLNRYYFKTEEDACKFVLYGTQGATPIHTEEGLTDYGYGYADVIYNNYDFGGWSAKTIPEFEYPLDRAKLIIKWHEENVAERECLWIEFNYFPFRTMMASTKQIMIAQDLKPVYYQAFITEENETEFDIHDITQYKKTEIYDDTIEKFQIYYPELESMYVSNSWDLIFCSYNLYSIKNEGDTYSTPTLEDEPTIEILKDTDGNVYNYNKLTDEYRKDGEDDPYKLNENGEYVNSKGEVLDVDSLYSPHDEWVDGLKEYTSGFESLATIIDKFTGTVNNSINEIKPITGLITEVLKDMPSILIRLIELAIMALVIGRVISRK